jgi:hypothetical protein
VALKLCKNPDELKAFMTQEYGTSGFAMFSNAGVELDGVCWMPKSVKEDFELERLYVKFLTVDDTFGVTDSKYFLMTLMFRNRFGNVQPVGFAFLRSKEQPCHELALAALLEIAKIDVNQIECIRLDGCRSLGNAAMVMVGKDCVNLDSAGRTAPLRMDGGKDNSKSSKRHRDYNERT